MKVVVDPGHGGSDPGAVGLMGTREADVNLAIGLKLRDLFFLNRISVLMTREDDRDVLIPDNPVAHDLHARCDIANKNRADLFISIHCNASKNSKACGTETWYYNAGQKIASSVQYQMAKLGLADRGVKQGNFYVLKYTDMPAILVEAAFISTISEETLLVSESFQWAVAKAIYAGIIKVHSGGV